MVVVVWVADVRLPNILVMGLLGAAALCVCVCLCVCLCMQLLQDIGALLSQKQTVCNVCSCHSISMLAPACYMHEILPLKL